MPLFLSFRRLSLSFRTWCGIQEVFLSSNVREKNNIDSCLKISGITENENNKEKERKHWIPNRVGDDKLLWIPAFAGMTLVLSFRTWCGIQEVFLFTPSLSFRTWCGIQVVFVLQNRKKGGKKKNGSLLEVEKKSGSPIKLGMTSYCGFPLSREWQKKGWEWQKKGREWQKKISRMTVCVLSRMAVGVLSRMTMGVLSRMAKCSVITDNILELE